MKKTLYREPLTAEEMNLHRNNYENETPAVYVGTYGKYNDGSLDGMWVDLSTFDAYEDFLEFCERLHADDPDPELMFQDFECFPREYYGESHLEFNAIKEWYELGEDEREAFEAYMGYEGEDATIEKFHECYQGKWDSPEDFAENLYLEIYGHEIPDFLQGYIDWSAVWRNLDTAGDYFESDGYIFSRY